MGKTSAMIIFFSIVLLIYGLINYYIWVRTSQALGGYPVLKSWIQFLLLFLIFSYPVTRFISSNNPASAVEVIHVIGSLWLGAILYLLISLVLIDLVRGMSSVLVPGAGWLRPDAHSLRLWLFILIAFATVTTLTVGYFNARNPVLKELSIDLPQNQQISPMRLLMVSDIHMGRIIGKDRVSKLVHQINAANPDVVILAGDMVDDEMGPVVSTDIGAALANIKAPLGVFAVTGNHEYIGDTQDALSYLASKNIRILRDEAFQLPNGIWLIGREDRDRQRFSGHERRSLTDLLQDLDFQKPVILIDHQPYELTEKSKAGVFLSLSGHTHHGQLWPLNYLTQAIFELSWGYRKIGEMHAYVSSGFGGWGPPARIGNRPEIVVFNLN